MKFLLYILSKLFYFATELRKLFYKLNLIKSIKVKAKVISVGNISVGGTGKTPFVIFLANLLLKNNISTVVISSGYNRKSTNTCIHNPLDLNKYDNNFNFPDTFGDEMSSIIFNLKDLPIVVDKQKWKAAKIANEFFNPQVILVDDGFQHWKLVRDLDFVIIDERTNSSIDEVLPLTRLRENFSNLTRASLLIKRDLDNFNNYIKSLNKENITIKTNQLGIFKFINEKYEIIDINEINSACTLTGIALPDKFHKFVANLGINIEKEFTFQDHYNFEENDLIKICRICKQLGINYIICTEKDYIKLKSYLNLFNSFGIEILISRIEFIVIEGIKTLISQLNSIGINITLDK